MSNITLQIGFICKTCGKATHCHYTHGEASKLKSLRELTCSDCDAKAS